MQSFGETWRTHDQNKFKRQLKTVSIACSNGKHSVHLINSIVKNNICLQSFVQCKLCSKIYATSVFYKHMRMEHTENQSGRLVREENMLQKPLDNECSYLTFYDMLNIFQSHLSLHYYLLYEKYRLSGIPVRFLAQLIYLNNAQNQTAALSQLSPSKAQFIISININFNVLIQPVLGHLLSRRTQPNALSQAEIISSSNIQCTSIKVRQI